MRFTFYFYFIFKKSCSFALSLALKQRHEATQKSNHNHGQNPSPHPTNKVGRLYPEFFPSFNFVQGGGERTLRKFRKGCTVLRWNREMTEKYEYCSTFPRTFVQDRSSCSYCSLNTHDWRFLIHYTNFLATKSVIISVKMKAL